MTTLKRRSLIVLVVVVLVVAIVLSSFVYLRSQNPYAGKMVNVSYSGFNSPALLLSTIAQGQHFFEANGINLTVKSFPFSQALIAA